MFIVWFTGIAAAALFAGLACYLAPLDPGVVVLQFAFTPQAFASIVHAWPPEHLQRYRTHLPIDFALLACYGVFGYTLASRTALFARYSARGRRAVQWALPLAAGFDAMENVLQLWLTAVPRFGTALPYFVSATCSAFKWALLLAFGAAVVHALACSRDR
jgi:hypothetical protein